MDACFRRYGARRVVFVKDTDCTKQNCEWQLEQLLQKTSRRDDTLVFYYGGHGTKTGLKTIGEKWRYKDIIRTMDRYFQGNKIWCLIDCCYSGCFSQHIPSNTTKSWLCAMSSHHTVEAGEDWCMTDTFARAMKGQYRNTNLDNSTDSDTERVLLTQDVVELMEDHHAIIKDDWMQATLTGSTAIDPVAPFPFQIPKDKLLQRDSATTSYKLLDMARTFVSTMFTTDPRTSRVLNEQEETIAPPVVDDLLWKRQVALQKGDAVYCKWRGGSPRLGASYLFPLYLPATLRSDPQSNPMVEVEFDYEGQCWTDVVEFRKHVVPPTYLWVFRGVDDYYRAHRILNQRGRYLDASIPAGTQVWALFKDDDVVYTGKVLDYHEINWYKVKVRDYYENYTGPFLWVEWKDEDGNWDIIPRSHCVIVSSSTSKPTLAELRHQARQDQPVFSAHQAIVQHMQSMGKTLVLEPPQDVMCLWDGVWHPGRTCDTMPLGKTLREHLHFEKCTGKYYCVYWTKEDGYSLMPERLIKRTAVEG